MIYEPSGRAREYSPLALNVFSMGCDHQCEYCYCQRITYGKWSETPNVRDQDSLPNAAKKANRQVLLSFMGDPYCATELEAKATLSALRTLKAHRCSVAILTKGGKRCLRDLDIFDGWPGGRIKVGATLTFVDAEWSREFEPGAALPADRMQALETLHDAGIQTWVSIEPVIDAAQSLACIEATAEYVDAYKVGKISGCKMDTDWGQFARDAVSAVRDIGADLYIKQDLREHLPTGYLTEREADMEATFLPDRPTQESGSLF